MSSLEFLLIFVLIIKSCLCQNDIEAQYFDDVGAWLLFRKTVEGVKGKFGIGYYFTVKYEITNIGTQNAKNIKIEDNWDWSYFQRYSDKSNTDKIMFESKEKLAPTKSISFSYQLIPTTIGVIAPERANISYSMEDDDDTDNNLIYGQSSNWIATTDDALMINDDDYNSNNNRYSMSKMNNDENNKIIILSSSMYSRAISSNFIHWILFILFCISSVMYPLCQYEQCRGDFDVFPFGLGIYLQKMVQFTNNFIIHKIRQQIRKINKSKDTKN